MAGLIPQSFIDDVLNRTDILDVIGSRIQLKKTGKNHTACCPFHKEKTPSFSVNPDEQFYYCFGCGAGGNAVSFLMDHDHLAFPQAVEELAKNLGLEVPYDEQFTSNKPRQAANSPLYPLLQAACDYYKEALKNHPQRKIAVNYLKQRGLSGEIARDFLLGFAPAGWDNLSLHLGGDSLTQKHLVDAGLLVENPDTGKRYDRFRERIIFPIRDTRGRVIGFGGRVLGDDKPKYLNSPETPVFHKGQELYGLFEARQFNRNLNEIIVVEGYMDVIALAQQGLRNAVATLGTATSEEHIKRLFRLVPTIIFCFDGDNAGRKAAWRALDSCLNSLKDGLHARFLFLPEGEDPDSLIRQEGLTNFQTRLQQNSLSLTEYFFQHLCDEADPRSLEGKAHLATLAQPLIQRIQGANLRTLMLQQLENITGLTAHSPKTSVPSTDNSLAAEHSSAPYDYPPYDAVDSYWGYATPNIHHQPSERLNSTKATRSKTRQETLKHAVESPNLAAIRTLLHYPALAQKVESTSFFSDENDTYAQLLIALLEALQKNETLSSFQLLTRWHGTEQGRLLRTLAEKEWLIDESNLEQQFFDTIYRLSARQRERRLEFLIQKSKTGALNEEEKQNLRELLQQHSSLQNSGCTR
ncbi:DNA primase [Pseudomonas sp. F1_0610]|uniref:DNA primase n=1 Tax=Pseudomonas sp. F1_0610 TaxID=3114284 RepID=UPI0039C11247